MKKKSEYSSGYECFTDNIKRCTCTAHILVTPNVLHLIHTWSCMQPSAGNRLNCYLWLVSRDRQEFRACMGYQYRSEQQKCLMYMYTIHCTKDTSSIIAKRVLARFKFSNKPLSIRYNRFTPNKKNMMGTFLGAAHPIHDRQYNFIYSL